MKKRLKSSKKNKFPKGWNERRVRQVLEHYENQTDEEAAAEDDRIFNDTRHTFMQIPAKLVPAVRKLIAKRAG
jgi:hypothetical protein